jgi:hypothetical protein
MVHRSLLFLAVALLRLVVAPTPNTRKTPARGARDFYRGLLTEMRSSSTFIRGLTGTTSGDQAARCGRVPSRTNGVGKRRHSDSLRDQRTRLRPRRCRRDRAATTLVGTAPDRDGSAGPAKRTASSAYETMQWRG